MLTKYGSATALEIARANAARSWMGGEMAAKERLAAEGEFLVLRHVPKFTLTRDMGVYTIGSCFARNIENHLIQLGIPVVTQGFGLPAEAYERYDPETRMVGTNEREVSRTAFNRYSVHSMGLDLRRVFNNETYKDEGLIEVSSGQWFDPHSAELKACAFDKAVEYRRIIEESARQIAKAQITFLTYGLTESWRDLETGLVINRTPPLNLLRRHKDRFEFVNFDFFHIMEESHSLLRFIRQKINPEMRFVVTVSPVPLSTTFRDMDVITATMQSKATLRTVTGELARQYDYVDYFPSYELATMSPRTLAWKADQLHVSQPMVRHIMKQFEAAYYPDQAAEKLGERLQAA